MSAADFDRKFGPGLVATAPTTAGVYQYLAADGRVLYVGKAQDLRRRLSRYRNASRKKLDRKLRRIVRDAHSLVYETCASEQAALLRESALIQQLRPTHNVDGAYSFLYPFVGLGSWNKLTLLCFSTQPHAFEHLPLQWYGCFRSRPRVKLAFSALVELLCFVAHREKVARLPEYPRLEGSRLVGLRQLPPALSESLGAFLAGEQRGFASALALLLLERPSARRDAAEVEAKLGQLAHFYAADALPLRRALLALGLSGTRVEQHERDALFIRAAGASTGDR